MLLMVLLCCLYFTAAKECGAYKCVLRLLISHLQSHFSSICQCCCYNAVLTFRFRYCCLHGTALIPFLILWHCMVLLLSSPLPHCCSPTAVFALMLPPTFGSSHGCSSHTAAVQRLLSHCCAHDPSLTAAVTLLLSHDSNCFSRDRC